MGKKIMIIMMIIIMNNNKIIILRKMVMIIKTIKINSELFMNQNKRIDYIEL